MRTFLLSIAAAATIVSAATLTAPRADAMIVGSASAIQAIIQDGNVVEDVALVCRHRAWSSRQRCVVVCRHRGWSSRRVC
jgi:hypothetical protein